MSKKDRQSGIVYLRTQDDINEECAARGWPLVRCPIKVFDLQGIGIPHAQFIEELSPTFERLAWDEYDVRRAQIDFLATHFPRMNKRLGEFKRRYMEGNAELSEVEDLLEELGWFQTKRFQEIRAYRRRAIANFRLVNRGLGNWWNQWEIFEVQPGAYVQEVDDERSVPRVFGQAERFLVEHPLFQRFLIAAAEMVEDAEEGQSTIIDELGITFHQMGLVAPPGSSPSNAPEGRHKDGVDYIVSALVVERSDFVDGGVSTVTDRAERVLLEWTLEPGQGIFQADEHSTLWHDISPIQVIDGHEGEEGVRNIFGFDIKVKRRLRESHD